MSFFLRFADHEKGEYGGYFGDRALNKRPSPKECVLDFLNHVWKAWQDLESPAKAAEKLLTQTAFVVNRQEEVVRVITFRKPKNFAESDFPVAVVFDAEAGSVLGAWSHEWGLVKVVA